MGRGFPGCAALLRSSTLSNDTLNGQSYSSTWLPLERLSRDHNVMVFWMGEEPNRQWGAGAHDAPPSFDVQP